MIGSEKLVTQIRSGCVSEIENPANFQAFPFIQHSSEDSYKSSLANSMCVVLMFDSQSQSEPNSEPMDGGWIENTFPLGSISLANYDS
jgi:hypothetical protein